MYIDYVTTFKNVLIPFLFFFLMNHKEKRNNFDFLNILLPLISTPKKGVNGILKNFSLIRISLAWN